MSLELPAYYSGLAPFRTVFETGNPILTYHKLGPRPAKVRLKGLYVSERLFERQLRELRDAGFEEQPERPTLYRAKGCKKCRNSGFSGRIGIYELLIPDPEMLDAVLAGPDIMLEGYDGERLLPAISCPVLILQADPALGGLADREQPLRGRRGGARHPGHPHRGGAGRDPADHRPPQ